MFCMYCGTQLEDGSQFCYKCGKRVLAQNVKKTEATAPEKVNNINENGEQTVAVRSTLSPQKNENGNPPTERWDSEPGKKPVASSAPVRRPEPKSVTPQNNAPVRRPEAKPGTLQNNAPVRRLEAKPGTPQNNAPVGQPESKVIASPNNETDNMAEIKREVPAVVTVPPQYTAAPGNGSMNDRTPGTGALVYNQTYKFTSIGLLAAALIITLTQAWYSVSAGLSSILGLGGGYFSIDSYLPESALNILNSMKNGKLGLIDSYRILKAIYEIMDAFGEDVSDVKAYVTLYLFLVVAIIGVVVIELILKVLDKGGNFMSFAMYLLGLLITYGFAYQLNDEIGSNLLGISIWAVISTLLALACSIVWIYYRKSATQVSSGDVQKSSWNASETRARAGHVINKSRETAEVIWQGSWGDYVRHHRVAVIVAAAAFIGLTVLLRLTGYSDLSVMLRYCYNFFTAVSFGLAVIYAEHKEYRFLAILGALCFVGDLILNFQSLSYMSFLYLCYVLFGNALTVGAIYLIGRYVQNYTLILMTVGGALVKPILKPLLGAGIVSFDSYTVFSLVGIVGAVLLYMFGNEAFCAILGLPEWRFEGVQGKQTIKCPVCGSEVEAGSAFCSRCGSKLF